MPPYRFELDRALAAWRRTLEHNRAFTAEDLDELEQHVRDQVAALTARGADEEAAFRRALGEVGNYAVVEAEYRKVYWGKLKRRRALLRELTWRAAMWKNYLKIAYRNVLREKGYAFINVFGLAVGIACCCFIFLYVQDEFSYDRYHAHADRIVRIAEDLKTTSETLYRATSAPPMGPAFVEDVPEVEAMVRFSRAGGVFQHQDRRFQNDNLFFADSTVFDVFSFELLQGNPKTALAVPFTMVLTETTARKYFGDENPLGQTLTHEGGGTFTITGILADIPHNSHFTFDGLISFTTLETYNGRMGGAWFWNNFYTYLLLRKGYDMARLEAHVAELIERHGIGVAASKNGGYERLPLVPLTHIHLTSHRSFEIEPNGNRSYLYIFSVVAVFILLIACVNFMNLATARSAKRAKEVGLRKVVGAHREQLAAQFLGESFLMTLFAVLLALGLCGALMPVFNALAGKALTLGALFREANVAMLVGIILAVGVIAGGYPALVLSRFHPMHVLKGAFRAPEQGALLRKGLVVFQFAISMVLIASTIVVMQQLSYLQRQDLGFTQEQMLVIDYEFGEDVQQHAETIKQALLANPSVAGASISGSIPGAEPFNWLTHVDVGAGDMLAANLNYYPVDFDFIDTYGLEIVAGRGFSRDFPADTVASVVVNEAMLAHLGWATPEVALEKTFEIDGRKTKVIGVVKDFHYRSLHDSVQPLGLVIYPGATRFFSLRLKTDQLQRTMADLERKWKALVPQRPFDTFFLDDYFNRQYRADERFAALFRYFAGLALLIASLGLFGLAAFTAESRTKEIGVRKVLGASVGQILVLLSKDFIRLVLAAVVVAVPLSYVAMQRWLEDFAYHTELSWWVFALAGLAALLIALVTVSSQAIRAALADPVESLRYE